jgi:DNA-binding NtrC family response regulator
MERSNMKASSIKSVLIVDDDESFSRILAVGLRMHVAGLNIFTASNGRTAMEMIIAADIDCVVTDLKMPVMDGFALLEFIRENRPRSRVIAISWLNSAELRERLKRSGVTEFLEKPVSISAVVNAILAPGDATRP